MSTTRTTLFGVNFDETDAAPTPPTISERLKGCFSRRYARRWAEAGVGLLVLLLIGIGASLWSRRAPSPNAAPATVAKFILSPKFQALPLDQRTAYLDALRPNMAQLPQDMRRTIGRQFGQARMEQRLHEYFALAPGAARDAYLDKAIAEMAARRAQMANRPGGPGGPGGAQAQNASNQSRAGRMRDRMENTPPETRAEMAQFRSDMTKRMQARGGH